MTKITIAGIVTPFDKREWKYEEARKALMAYIKSSTFLKMLNLPLDNPSSIWSVFGEHVTDYPEDFKPFPIPEIPAEWLATAAGFRVRVEECREIVGQAAASGCSCKKCMAIKGAETAVGILYGQAADYLEGRPNCFSTIIDTFNKMSDRIREVQDEANMAESFDRDQLNLKRKTK